MDVTSIVQFRSFYLQRHNTKQQTKAIKTINPHTEPIIIGRKSLLGGTWWSVCLLGVRAGFAVEEAAKKKRDKP